MKAVWWCDRHLLMTKSRFLLYEIQYLVFESKTSAAFAKPKTKMLFICLDFWPHTPLLIAWTVPII